MDSIFDSPPSGGQVRGKLFYNFDRTMLNKNKL